MVRSQEYGKPFDFTNQQLQVRFPQEEPEVGNRKRRSGHDHSVISVLKQNPYKNEETTTMDNPVVNFKDFDRLAIIEQQLDQDKLPEESGTRLDSN